MGELVPSLESILRRDSVFFFWVEGLGMNGEGTECVDGIFLVWMLSWPEVEDVSHPGKR
ncbi:hypothetical protein COLO4_34032 [Corchorus olitorius]|uniref:Uncharacterized protein n=1 Tax=Corchorus olitorius TaxID=93759 RepID=A0A1R3GPA7_9ROSI|nr:hypothetical protein COLO4_34032 [Corchorus olitorius]